jgi:hypothetical protein
VQNRLQRQRPELPDDVLLDIGSEEDIAGFASIYDSFELAAGFLFDVVEPLVPWYFDFLF